MLMSDFYKNDPFDSLFFDLPFYRGRDRKRTGRKPYAFQRKSLMKTDVKEGKDGYELVMELPGFKKDEIKVSFEEGYLTVDAAKNAEEDVEKNEKYICRERFSGACQRRFYIGEEITDTDIRGELKEGILKITIPKKEAKPAVEEKKYITIEG